jgi:hypothetical protein
MAGSASTKVYALQPGLDVGFVDARHAGSNASPLSGTRFDSEADLDYVLINSLSMDVYTIAAMTLNDKIFAVRSVSDSLGYLPTGTVTGVGGSNILVEYPADHQAAGTGTWDITWHVGSLPVDVNNGVTGYLRLTLDTVDIAEDTLTVTISDISAATSVAFDNGAVFVTGQIVQTPDFVINETDGTITLDDIFSTSAAVFCVRV